jgi:signal transduction histidine kinase/ActR/RegA family two-component response regulator
VSAEVDGGSVEDTMNPEGRSGPEPPQPLDRQVAIAQIDALFGTVTLGVCTAGITAIVLASILHRIGYVDLWTGALWTLYINACAACHILLGLAYRRWRRNGENWRAWGLWFTAICLAEGAGWGWAPIGLATGGRFDVELVVALVMLAVTAGVIPVFGPYLPAFFALFLPATVPFMIASLTAADPVRHAAFLLTLVYIGGMGAIGIASNRSFKQMVGLRIRTEAFAADLQRQKEIAERASLAKSSFLAAASHDLRQPVHALGLFVGALRGVAMPPEGHRLLEQIETSTSAMDGLFAALLDISRLDAGVVEPHPRAFAIGPLLDRICRDHVDEAKAKGVSLVCAPCSLVVETDPVLMERIVRNLVSNAVRYTDRGRILVGCRRQGAMVWAQVWDTGLGIPADQHERVFQEYYQLGNSERDRTKGLGLGLAIVRRLTDLLGCGLTLRSQPGRGSCFEVAVPLAMGVAAVGQADPPEPSGALALGLVVVVDDEQAIREATSALVRGWGHDVVAAGSGDEAIRRLSTCSLRPALLICDYRLRDGENGIAVIERLRSEYNEALPAILITGDTAPARLAEAQASGLLLLHKPVSNGKLRAAIGRLISAVPAETA